MMETKRCCHCKQELPLSSFSRNVRSSDGYDATCRACHSERRKRKYEEMLHDPDKLNSYRDKVKQIYRKHKSDPYWVEKKRAEGRERYAKNSQDPTRMEAKRERLREWTKNRGLTKETIQKHKDRMKQLNRNSISVSRALRKLGFNMDGIHGHHWNYDQIKSVFLIPKDLHVYLHRHLIVNCDDRHLYTKKGNVRIENPTQAAEIFAEILAKKGYYEPLKLVDFSEDETKVTEYCRRPQADV